MLPRPWLLRTAALLVLLVYSRGKTDTELAQMLARFSLFPPALPLTACVNTVAVQEAVAQREGVRAQGPPQLSSIRSFVIRTTASFHLLQDRIARDDDAAATLERANDARVLADVLDTAELPSTRAPRRAGCTREA